MHSYQDLLRVGENELDRMNFIQEVINAHKTSKLYNDAVIAESYFKKQNKTIMEFQKLLYTVTGEAIPDNYSADYKLRSQFFKKFITQENQYSLGNGISWNNNDTGDKLGTRRKSFDIQVQKAGIKALWGAVSFGFWNFDHLDVFSILEYAPLWDENDGAMKAGIRFWQVDEQKPMRATLYEMDGYTDYIWNKVEENGKQDFKGQILHEKRKYVQIAVTSEADGTEILDGINYVGFPIVPLWANEEHQNELEGLREQIDCYDLIKSGFANTVDEASYIYWAIQNAGGMDDIDLANFVERMKTVHAGLVEDSNARAEAHTIEAPYASREALLDRLRNDLYENAMALDTKPIQAGAITATQIKSSYKDLDIKADAYEECLIEFIDGILELAGIDDEPTFTRSRIVNVSEEIQNILSSATYLERGYVTEKILTLLGDADKAEDMIKQMDADDIKPLRNIDEEVQAIDEEMMNGEEDNVQ
jgi:hypothetical protein